MDQQPLSPPPPAPDPEEPPPRMTALEVRNSYGIRAVVFLALTLWFGYDGWFNAEIHAKTFNKIGATLLGSYLIYCLVMAGSAALTVRRQQQSPPPPPPPATP